jgi:hypothetical protein
MSLTVPPGLFEQAKHGEVDDAEFLDCVRTSLPYAWDVVTGLVKELEAGGGEFAGNQAPTPDDAARGQLLRMVASDAMRCATRSSDASACGWRSRTATAQPSSVRPRPPPWRCSPRLALSFSTRVPSSSTVRSWSANGRRPPRYATARSLTCAGLDGGSS